MKCKIADLIIEIPEAGGLAPRCQAYLADAAAEADMVLGIDEYLPDHWEELTFEQRCYIGTCNAFYFYLLKFKGMTLHASAITLDGKAYLFSGPSTVGKSTHARFWKQLYGDAACVINDDKPALRLVDNRWYAYGTHWCGKDGINENRKAILGGICFLKQGRENRIRRLTPAEAIPLILSQTIYKFRKAESLDMLLTLVGNLVQQIPVFELENLPNEEAARLSSSTMLSAAES